MVRVGAPTSPSSGTRSPADSRKRTIHPTEGCRSRFLAIREGRRITAPHQPVGEEELVIHSIEAVFENGVLRPLSPLNLRERQRVVLTVQEEPDAEDLLDREYMREMAARAN